MTAGSTSVMDENTRRYYLDVMGIQCWQAIDSQAIAPQPLTDSNSGAPEPDSDRDVAVISYQDIDNAVQQCTGCALYKTRKQALTGRGNPSADLMFVLLSPSTSDDENGMLCSGEASTLFSKMLAAIDINIDDVYITSLLKCKVPEKHTVLPKEILSCRNYLSRQIQSVKPAFVVVLGETAARCLLQKDVSIDGFRKQNTVQTKANGLQVESVPLFVSYSPVDLLQDPDKKRKAWSDLQLLQKLIGKN